MIDASVCPNVRCRAEGACRYVPCIAAPDILVTVKDRTAQYGDFGEQARITQDLKAVMVGVRGWAGLSPDKKEALEMIQHKVARVLNGNPENFDSWHDISGYAKLAADRVKR